MLTNKESKILRNILNGKMRKFHIYGIILTAVIFIIIMIASLNVKNKLSKFLDIKFEQSNSALTKLETKTELEDSLKSLLLESDEGLKNMTITAISVSFNWRIWWFGTVLIWTITNFFGFSSLERIIKKLQEEKETKEKT